MTDKPSVDMRSMASDATTPLLQAAILLRAEIYFSVHVTAFG